VSLVGNNVVADSEVHGGVMAYYATMQLTNAIIASNSVEPGDSGVEVWSGVLGATGGTLEITNATIYGNLVDAGSGTANAGIMRDTDGGTSLLNVTISGNTIDGDSVLATISESDASFSYCNFYDYEEPGFTYGGDPTSTTGMLQVDPGFTDTSMADPWDWDLTLGPKSPLIDMGDPTMTDADGTLADIGAYGGLGSGGW